MMKKKGNMIGIICDINGVGRCNWYKNGQPGFVFAVKQLRKIALLAQGHALSSWQSCCGTRGGGGGGGRGRQVAADLSLKPHQVIFHAEC